MRARETEEERTNVDSDELSEEALLSLFEKSVTHPERVMEAEIARP